MLNAESVLENKTRKMLLDFDIETGHLISTRRPNLVKFNRKKRESVELWTLPFQLTTVKLKESKKSDMYEDIGKK